MTHDVVIPRAADDDSYDPLLIGQRIRARRLQRGLSLAQLAQRVAVDLLVLV